MTHATIRQFVALTLILVMPAIARAQAPDPGHVPVVLILPFDTERTGRAPAPGTSETMADVLGAALVENGAFRVMDASWLNVARPTSTGRDEVRSRALAAHVDYVIEGVLSQYTISQRRKTVGGLPFVRAIGGFNRSTTDSDIEVNIRIIDVQTGEIVSTTTGRGNANYSAGGLAIGGILHGMPGLVGAASSASNMNSKLTDRAVANALAMASQGVINAAARLKK